VLLTNLELEVMQPVWEHPAGLPVRAITEAVNTGRQKKLAYNTVQTMLGILQDKGVVRATKGAGRAFSWQAQVSREEVHTSMVGDLVDRLFDGHVQPLLTHLVEKEALAPDELRALRELIDGQLSDDEPDGIVPGGRAPGKPGPGEKPGENGEAAQ